MPECLAVLRARLEHEWGGEGTREYIRVLKLRAEHSLAEVGHAIERGLRCNALIRAAIAPFLIPQEDWRHGSFRLDGREHLRQVQVAQTEVAAYAALVGEAGRHERGQGDSAFAALP